MANVGPVEFARQVRQEVARVTWPTRAETGATTVMVFLMVIAAAAFFFLADQVMSALVRIVLAFGA